MNKKPLITSTLLGFKIKTFGHVKPEQTIRIGSDRHTKASVLTCGGNGIDMEAAQYPVFKRQGR